MMLSTRPTHIFGAAALALGVMTAACGDDSGGAESGGNGASSTGASASSGGAGAQSSGGGGAGASGSGGSGATGASGPFDSFADMCAAPGVVFCDDFEGGWDETWMEDGGDVQIVSGSAVEGEGASIIELSTYGSTQSSKLLRTFADADRIHIRFDVQYAEDYDNSGGSHGPILGGSDSPPWGMFGTAGMKPNGSDFFVLNFEPDGVVGQGGEFGFYAYFVNMQVSGDGNYWGNGFTSTQAVAPVITPGAWQCTEYSLTLNAPGSADGTADFWVDGVHHGTYENLEWRTDPSLRISTFALDSYNHMNDGPIPEDQPNRVRYDNFVISTEPVGCL
jgi:hypothetical protein